MTQTTHAGRFHRRSRSPLLAHLLLAAALAWSPAGLAAVGQTPDQVAQAYIQAIRSDGLNAIPAFVHPEELERFKAMLMPVLAGDTPLAESMRTGFFGPDTTAASLQSLDPLDFMARFVALGDGKMKSLNVRVGDYDILGTINEGPLVHVVARMSAGAGPLQMTEIEVLSLRPYGDTWRVLLSGEFEGIAQALNAQFATPPTMTPPTPP